MILNTLQKSLLSLSLIILLLSLSACSSLMGSDKEAHGVTEKASGYYRGHYGDSGWDDSVNEKGYSNNASVFTGNNSENHTR